mmetsp:Transcript_27490/g.60072  ORF Transcript_27490/g.60072 Transcript_27490/m.60072 type:complete len:88 (-) Transcript_27490:726-989(-)
MCDLLPPSAAIISSAFPNRSLKSGMRSTNTCCGHRCLRQGPARLLMLRTLHLLLLLLLHDGGGVETHGVRAHVGCEFHHLIMRKSIS